MLVYIQVLCMGGDVTIIIDIHTAIHIYNHREPYT